MKGSIASRNMCCMPIMASTNVVTVVTMHMDLVVGVLVNPRIGVNCAIFGLARLFGQILCGGLNSRHDKFVPVVNASNRGCDQW